MKILLISILILCEWASANAFRPSSNYYEYDDSISEKESNLQYQDPYEDSVASSGGIFDKLMKHKGDITKIALGGLFVVVVFGTIAFEDASLSRLYERSLRSLEESIGKPILGQPGRTFASAIYDNYKLNGLSGSIQLAIDVATRLYE